MTPLIAAALIAVSLGAAVFAGWHTWRGFQFSNPLFWVLGALEVAILASLVGGAIALGQTDRPVEGVLFISYLITVACIPPAAVVWGVTDRTRWGTGVVVIAMITVAALVLRVLQIWEAPGA